MLIAVALLFLILFAVDRVKTSLSVFMWLHCCSYVAAYSRSRCQERSRQVQKDADLRYGLCMRECFMAELYLCRTITVRAGLSGAIRMCLLPSFCIENTGRRQEDDAVFVTVVLVRCGSSQNTVFFMWLQPCRRVRCLFGPR